MAVNNKTLEEDADADGDDIEEAAAITGGASTNSTAAEAETTCFPGGLEIIDEDAAPVPLIQQVAEMELAEAASKPSQLPTYGAMLEQMEDEDDPAPRPFNSAEFEDESKPEINFRTESNGEDDDGPPLPHTFQRDSLTVDGEEKKVAASQKMSASSSHAHDHEATTVDVDVAESNYIETGGGNPEDIQQMDDDENQSLGDEENLQQRFVATGNNSTSDNEVVALVSTTATAAAERNPSLPILEAWMVEEEEEEEEEEEIYDISHQAAVATVPVFFTPGGHDTVYEATPLEPELPWWKERRMKVSLVLICVLVTALTASLGIFSSRSPSERNTVSTAPPDTAEDIFTPSHSPSTRNYAMRGSFPPTLRLEPVYLPHTHFPTIPLR